MEGNAARVRRATPATSTASKAKPARVKLRSKRAPEYQALDDEAKAARAGDRDRAKKKSTRVSDVSRRSSTRSPILFKTSAAASPSSITTSKPRTGIRKRAIPATRPTQSAHEVVEVELPTDDGTVEKLQDRCNYAQLEKMYDELRDEKARNLGEKAELLKAAVRVGQETRRLSEESAHRPGPDRDRWSEK